MKKLSVFALLGLLVLGMAATASAADIKATGSWKVEGWTSSNLTFVEKGQTNMESRDFNIEQRMRTAFQFIANENLKAVLDTQIGTGNWGNGMYQVGSGRGTTASTTVGTNSANGGNGNIMLRKGYIDFKWPGTKTNFLVGFQTVALPAAFGGGSAIFDDQAAAAIVVTPLMDNLKMLAGYSRLTESNAAATTTAGGFSGSGSSTDAYFAALPIDFKGFNITPFAAYANSGARSATAGASVLGLRGFQGVNSSASEGVRAYWGGVATTITALDGFKIMADFNYGKATWNNQSSTNAARGGRSGWLADIAVDYTGLKYMTPSAFFVYSSGEKGNSTDGGSSSSGRMPVIGEPQNWAVGSFFFGDRNFISRTTPNGGSSDRHMGFWVAGLSLKDMTFIDKLSHTFHLLYAKGTNDKKFIIENGSAGNNALYGGFLTTKDSLWEVDFNTKYMIYDELSVYLDLGYVNANFNKDAWGDSTVANAADLRQYGSNNAYRAGFGIAYNF